MATITGLTADRMLEIEDASIVDGEVVGDNLILTTHGGETIDAGNVRGPIASAGAVTDESIVEALNLAGSQSWEYLETRFEYGLNVKAFGAKGDITNDDTPAFNDWLNALEATGKPGFIPEGMYRITDNTLARIDKTVPFTIIGAGPRKTYLIGDFVGPGSGILDFSTSNLDIGTPNSGHYIKGIGFIGRGTAGDPIGLKMLNAQECIVEDLDAPALGANGVPTWSGNPTNTALANSICFVTNDNNSKWTNIRSQGGFQPVRFDVDKSILVDITSGSTTVVAQSALFTAGMVGNIIAFASGSDTDSNAIWRANITAFTDSTHVTIDTAAPSTATGVRIVIGSVTGSITSGQNTLTVNAANVSSDWVGMQVHIIGAANKADVSAGADGTGLLSTTIVSVAGSVLTLDDSATVGVSGGTILFCPALFIGSLQGDDADFSSISKSRYTNHSWWTNVHLEGFACAGVIVNRALYVNFVNLKLHGAAYSYASDWGECYYAGVFSEIRTCSIKGVQQAYGIFAAKFHISASRGSLSIEDLELANLVKDGAAIQVVSSSSEFRLVLGDVFVLYPLTNFADTYLPWTVPYRYNIVSKGNFTRRSKLGKSTLTPAHVSRGITAVEGRVTIADDSVHIFKPPGNFGFMMIATQSAGCGAIFMYRTSDDSGGVLITPNFAGTNTDVLTGSTVLAGTTGTDGKMTVACDSTGNIRIENRRGFTIQVGYIPTGFGS